MYFSRLILDPRSRRVQRELANPYELHRTVLRAFPASSVHRERNADAAAGVLCRIDLLPPYNEFALLVQSQLAPDWSFLLGEEQAGYLRPTDPFGEENPAVKERDLAFRPGQILQFRLRANPTKRLSAGKGHKGKRVGIYDDQAQIAWLQRKVEQGGGRLLTVQSSRDEKIRLEGAIPRDEERHKLELFAVQFDGQVQVTDPTQFRALLHQGIGSGKAFGFGLLSVAPVR